MQIIERIKNIQYIKLLIAFFGHIFPAMLFGAFTGIWFNDLGVPELICILIQIIIMAYIIYEGYKEEVQRHYPFIKMLCINLFSLILLFIVGFSELYLLTFLAIYILVKAIHYRCKNCIEYTRYDIDAD